MRAVRTWRLNEAPREVSFEEAGRGHEGRPLCKVPDKEESQGLEHPGWLGGWGSHVAPWVRTWMGECVPQTQAGNYPNPQCLGVTCG